MWQADFSDFISKQYQAIRSRNPRYSMRAMARKLGISSGGLSDLMRGRLAISEKRAAQILGNIEGDPNQKNLLRIKMGFEPQFDWTQMEVSEVQLYRDWVYLAVFHCFEAESIDKAPAALAERLCVSVEKINEVISGLIRLKYLSQDEAGVVTASEGNHTSSDGVTSDDIRYFHRETMRLGLLALDSLPMEKRDITSITLAANAGQLNRIKEEIRSFYKKIAVILESSDSKDQVFRIAVQAFPLDFRIKEQ